LDDGDVVLQRFADIECLIDTTAYGHGELTLTNRKIVWRPANGGETQAWAWREVVMHAEASDEAVHARPCLYCHLTGADEETLRELRFVPKEGAVVHALFSAFNQGAELNPDPIDHDNDDEGDWIFNHAEVYGANGHNHDQNNNNDNEEEEEDGEGSNGAYEDDEEMGDADNGAFEDA